MAFAAREVNITDRVEKILRTMKNGYKTEHRLVVRASIVLHAAHGRSNAWIAERLHVSVDTCSKWRIRFAEKLEHLKNVEEAVPCMLAIEVESVLSDAPRSGCPRKFTGEQIAQIMKLACTKVSARGHERRVWTSGLLADEAARQGIVEEISPRTVRRNLHDAHIRPWHTEYWMHSPDKDENPEEFAERVSGICSLYLRAIELKELGTHVVCVDEKTAIQALMDKYPAKPVRPGFAERKEFEYVRKGTLALIAGLDVATGEIFPGRIGKTRTETDFAAAIRKMISTDPDAEWIIVADGLNTHKSESVVRFVAEQCSIEEDPGRKGRNGILRDMKSRADFLECEDHRIRFLFTPRHTSWVNQVEIWFGTLSHQLLNRRSYGSTKALDASLRKYIRQYNVTAKPYKWTYTGIPLAA